MAQWIAETPALAPYRHGIMDDYRQQKHVLDEAGEKLLSYSSLLRQAPTAIFQELSTSDIKFPKVTLADGKELTLSPGAYQSVGPAYTHLRDVAEDELANADTRRWGALEVVPTKADLITDLIRMNSLWPLLSGLACCAIEMMSIVNARYDVARFGSEAFRASPRQADLLILSGRVSIKMAPVIRRIYDQMLEPKWVIAMGACSSSGGVFSNYAVVQGADKFLPIDVHVPGCPPRPEALMYALIKLQRKIKGNPDLGWRERYDAYGTEEYPYGTAGAPEGVDLDQLIAERRKQMGNGRPAGQILAEDSDA